MNGNKLVLFCCILLILMPSALAQFKVELLKPEVAGFVEGSIGSTPATIFNEGRCKLNCWYETGRYMGNFDYHVIDGLLPNDKYNFDVEFKVPREGSKEPYWMDVHVYCKEQAGEGCGDGKHEATVSFKIFNIRTGGY